MTSAIVLDIITIVIIAVCVVYGCTKGFIKTLYKLFSGIIALLVALVYAKPFSGVIAQTDVFKNLVNNLYANVDKIDIPVDGGQIVESQLSEASGEFLSKLGISLEEICEYISSLVSSGVDNVTQGVKDYIIAPAADSLAHTAAFVILFVLSLIALRVICFVLDKTVNISGFGGVNKFLGFILGGGAAFVYSIVFCLVSVSIFPYLAASGVEIGTDTIAETHLFKLIYGIVK